MQILLLSGLDETLSVERATLRQLGARVRSLRSGRSALEYLAGLAGGAESEKPDVLVCTESLSDMSARDFLRALGLLAERTGRPLPPALAVCGGRAKAFLELGAAAAVTRPYTARAMSEALVAAQNAPEPGVRPAPVPGAAEANSSGAAFGATPGLSGGRAADLFFVKRQRAAGEKLSAATATADGNVPPEAIRSSSTYREVARAVPEHQPDMADVADTADAAGLESPAAVTGANPLLHTRDGLRALRAGRLAEARSLFKAALAADGLDLEAALGLAGVYRRQRETAGEQRWLNRAALVCLETGQPARARVIQERLPREQAENPHLTEARHLLLEENYSEAAEAFLKLSLRKGQPPLYQLVARAAQLADYPEEALHELCEAFRQNGQPGLAANLYQRLLAEADAADRLEFEPQSFWTRFPRLYEALAVAKFTLRAWRAAT
ncbi:MAG: hypothetical protein LBM64_04375 [Deltaproteobacteria bacterium]|jgi:hypothetical protein|nr:hypothetical protein [Deltaproteobacteria bacterium]